MSKEAASFLVFFGMVTAVISSAVYYSGLRLTQGLGKESILRPTVWTVLILWAVLLITVPFLTRVVGLKNFEISHPDIVKALNLVGYGFMGFIAIMVFSLFVLDAVRLIWALVFLFSEKLFPTHADVINPSRRELLFGFAPWGVLGLTGILSAVGYKDAVGFPKVKRVFIPHKNLSPHLEGFKIVQISDLHVGSTIKRNYVEQVVEATLAENPDLIAITGDLVDGHVETLSPELEPLTRLKSTHGIFYITGNHEYYWGAEEWVAKARSLGFKTLLNEHRVLEHGGSKIMIAGIPDVHAERFGPQHKVDALKAVVGAPACDFNIFLSHQPGGYMHAEKIPCDLQLSGHTHAGQFYPVGFLIRFFHRYYKGLNRHNDSFWVYVNPGTGYWGPPNRLGIPAEITLLELTKA